MRRKETKFVVWKFLYRWNKCYFLSLCLLGLEFHANPPLPHFPSPPLSSSWEPNYLAEAGPVREDQLYYYSVSGLVLLLLLLLLLLRFSIKCPLPCCSENPHKDKDTAAQLPGQGTAQPGYLNCLSSHIAQIEILPDPQPCRAPSRFGLLYKSHTVSGRFH